MVELLSSHSKEYDTSRYICTVVESAAKCGPRTARSIPKPAAARLSSTEVAELLKAYESGASTYELAARFRIRRETVTMHLKRAGLEVRPGPQVALDEAGERRVAILYRDGLSMRSIARQMGISDNTVLKALRAQSVPSRPRTGGKRRTECR
jgi:DNA-binding CsgD family transcriptional regulator